MESQLPWPDAFQHQIKRRLALTAQLARGLFYLIRLFFKPADIERILKLGDLLTSTKSFELFVLNVKADAGAAVLIQERYSKMKGRPLEDYPAYASGTFGAQFVSHLKRHGLKTYHHAISAEVSDGVYLRERQREIHDLLHAIFNLDIEVEDETELNAIIVAQTQSPIAVVIVAGAILHTLFMHPTRLKRVVTSAINGLNRGRQIKNIFSVRWEDYLDRPIAELRHEINFEL